MSYTIRHFDKSNITPALVVNDKKTDDVTTTLSFYGLNSVDFGQGLNENYLHLMEHFCNKDIAIAKLVPGQLWFDKPLKKMKIWNGSRWHILKEYTTNKLPIGFVTIVGNIINGSTVSTANTLDDEDGLGDFSYQWYLDAVAIRNATDSTYTIALSDVGHKLAVSLSYVDGSHNTETVYSKQYPINAAVNKLPTGSLTISGTVGIGELLTATINDIQDADGFIGGNFGWLLNGVDISGENNNTYTIQPGDGGGTIKAKFYFIDLNNNNETVFSNAVVVPYAVTTTTQEPTTTTTQPGATTTTTEPPPTTTTTTAEPTTTTSTTRPDTSVLDGQIVLCNATVPVLKDIWFDAETARIATEKNLADAVIANVGAAWEDNLSRRIALSNLDDAAIGKVNTTYSAWLTGINTCIQNKQELFNILGSVASATSLTQAYQSKLEIQKIALDNVIALYDKTVNDYSAQIAITEESLASRIELENLSDQVWTFFSKYQTAWSTTFENAKSTNLNIIEILNSSASVATITTLSQYKTTTLKDTYDKLKVISDAADAKSASVAGNTSIDLSSRMQWEALSDDLNNKTAAAKTKWFNSITEGTTLNAYAQDLLT